MPWAKPRKPVSRQDGIIVVKPNWGPRLIGIKSKRPLQLDDVVLDGMVILVRGERSDLYPKVDVEMSWRIRSSECGIIWSISSPSFIVLDVD